MIDLLGAGESGFGQFNALTITATLGVVTATLALWTIMRPKRFPPGPRGLPIVGSIYSINDSPEVVFGEWAKKYGDVVGFKAGQRWMVVLNRQALIKEAVLKQGEDFAGRPDFYSLELLTEGFKDIAFSPYNETWKLHRRLAHSALSYELEDPKVVQWMDLNDELSETSGLGLAADYFSWAKYLPTSGARMIKKNLEKQFGFLRSQVEETREHYDPENINNFYSLLLKAQEDARKEGENVDKLTDTHVFQTIADMFGAGIQTTVETLYWAMALLATYPEIQAKIRAEIDDVIGRDRLPTINDRGKLVYTEASLYEVLRYSSIVPTNLHATTRDTEFGGYHIPKGTVVLINTHSMHYDPQEWDQPDKFLPEHFMDGSGTVREHPPSFLPFGAGRRGCLGEAVAKADLFLIFSWFLQNYTFSKVPGKESEDILNMIPQTAFGRLLISYEIMINKRD
ncbi:steroid 17-alpha-hydroxylase/17,20 lyase isoform X2 [Strongylocentrotus purpuratus]|uniref:Uncharacterized protein n=1 Tax=Strongylocentrotus purpuratus TaxID=7668 RepID=A0A7M7NFE2_STRPU|nr:steroid 17-alpha-hydroxylase/17,20 lyase isoform X2 [Strongylocentrotus purpuratus]